MRRHADLGIVFLVASATALSCVETQFPGSELIGSFDFTVSPPPSGPGPAPAGKCTFSEMPETAFSFSGTFSRSPEDGQTFFTLGETDHPATFDGQFVNTFQSAPRRFDECSCPDGTRMDETLSVALLSRSQVDALQDPTQCPPNALDGGVPPVGGGVTGPGSNNGSFDAVFACGELVDVVVPEESCICAQCSVTYSVQGIRR